jgi:hypothetical protein
MERPKNTIENLLSSKEIKQLAEFGAKLTQGIVDTRKYFRLRQKQFNKRLDLKGV